MHHRKQAPNPGLFSRIIFAGKRLPFQADQGPVAIDPGCNANEVNGQVWSGKQNRIHQNYKSVSL